MSIWESQEELETLTQQIEELQGQKRALQERMKRYRKDLEILAKYATEEQRERLPSLEVVSSSKGLNPVAQLALDIMAKAKEPMTNRDLFGEYVNSLPPEKALNYTKFNINIRSLFSKAVLTRTKGGTVMEN